MEEKELPPFVLAERDSLLVEIRSAFSGVSRQGGVSWGDSEIMDMSYSRKNVGAARDKDQDTIWEQVLENPEWNPDAGLGGWAFLDAISFRYYLPAAMILAIRKGGDSGILFALTLPKGNLGDYSQSKWTLFNPRQRHCIKRFLQYMGIVETFHEATADKHGWFAALRLYWGEIPEDEVVRASPGKSSP